MCFRQVAIFCVAGLLTAAFDSPELVVREGDARLVQHEYKRAIESYTKIIESGRGGKEILGKAYFGRAKARFALAEATLAGDAAFVEALQDNTRAIELLPGGIILFRHRGTIYQYLGAYPEAFADFKTIRRFEGRLPMWSLVRKGGLQKLLGDYEGALESFRTVLEAWGRPLMPPNYHMALTYMRQQKYGEAIEALDEGMKAQDDFAWAYTRRGCAKANLGRYDEALKDYQHGVDLYRQYPKFDLTYPSDRYDERIVGEELALLQGIAGGKIPPDPARLRKLCTQYWWQIHFDTKRERSPLLPQ